jgi:glycosyltransferase involved in cell wall biosynthesis
VERFVVHAHLDTVWRRSGLDDSQRNAAIARSSALVALTSAPSTWAASLVALALGVPVVARDVGALRTLLGNAAIVLPAEVGAAFIATAVERLIGDDELCTHLALRGRARADAVADWSWRVPMLLRLLHRELVS